MPVESGNDVLQSTKLGSQREHRIISSTDSGTGYHTANVAEHYVQKSLPADGNF
jgi:hypothetical protein